MGMPLPDPLGLNEVGNWLNFSGRPPQPGQPPAGSSPNPGPAAGPAERHRAGTRHPMRGQYQAPYTPVAGFTDPVYNPDIPVPNIRIRDTRSPGMTDPAVPPVPPVPPMHWRRKEPIGAIILVGIGLILLLNEMGYVAERFLHFLWPLLFIALGVWLIIRRMNDSKGGAE